MPLSALSFSDLLIFPDGPDGSARLKGCPGAEPGMEQLLFPVPEDCRAEIDELRQTLPEAFIKRAKSTDECREIPRTIRLAFHGVHYRVADLCDVNNSRTWFLRRLPERVPALEELGLPPRLMDWLLAPEHRYGLILFCGAQASGKTTTASALTTARLTAFGGHAVTFENPAEQMLAGRWGEYGQCIQTEILSESDLAQCIEMTHRYSSPNIVFVGEIKTKYAATEVLRVAQGSNQQLVIATIHGLDIIAALDRLINWARELDGQNARHNLAGSLLAIIQQDLSTVDGKRVLDVPQFLLVPFTEEAKAIRAQLREGNLESLRNDMREQGHQWGMRRKPK